MKPLQLSLDEHELDFQLIVLFLHNLMLLIQILPLHLQRREFLLPVLHLKLGLLDVLHVLPDLLVLLQQVLVLLSIREILLLEMRSLFLRLIQLLLRKHLRFDGFLDLGKLFLHLGLFRLELSVPRLHLEKLLLVGLLLLAHFFSLIAH